MKLIVSIFLFVISLQSFACDGCNISTGLVNSDPVDYLSIKHRNVYYSGEQMPFFRHTGEGGALAETYRSYDLIGKYFFHRRFYVQGLLSISDIKIESHELDTNISGLSDPVLLLGYQNIAVFEKWQLTYNFLGGLDFGIGEYDVSMPNDVDFIEFAPGSKSSDVLIGAEFMAKFKKVGLLYKSNLKVGLLNNDKYRFGQIINSSFATAYYHEREKLMYVPYIGITYENDLRDQSNELDVLNSSSKVLYGDLGVNLFFNKKILLGGKYQFRLYKDVPGWKSLDISGFEMELTYVFGM